MMQSITYPLTIQNGSLTFSKDVRVIIERIYSVLKTRPLERIERPEYGTPDYVFNSVPNDAIIPSRIEASLIDQIPELQNLEVEGEFFNDGKLKITIKFVYMNQSQNLNLLLES